MSEEDWEARKRVLELEERFFELQGISLLTLSELRALEELATIIWEHQQVKVGEKSFREVLTKMQEEHLEMILSSFADLSMKDASAMRQNIDRLLKKTKK